ncbi:AAA-associated domain-containing protein [Candidatus Nomurabacteria bacterium]|nr:AAA-associated domain-containing protein [Candidatus Nomurabacteria bacterium]
MFISIPENHISSTNQQVAVGMQQSLPQTSIPEILGLLGLLKSKGGKEDIYKLAAELKMEFGTTLAVIRGAELLGLVNTPGGDVVIEVLGEKLSRSRINTKKSVIKEQMQKIKWIQNIIEHLKTKDNCQTTREQFLQKLSELNPDENSEQTFDTLVNWGRYAELFGYNDDTQIFYLDLGK